MATLGNQTVAQGVSFLLPDEMKSDASVPFYVVYE